MDTYSVIHIKSEVKKEANASNNIDVTYTSSEIIIVVGNTNIAQANLALKMIEQELSYFKSLLIKKEDIYKSCTGSRRHFEADTLIKTLEAELFNQKDKNVYLKSIDIGQFSVWRPIEYRIAQLVGEYLIIPSQYKKLI